MNEFRCHKLVRDAIAKFRLNLSGLIVLTEAASGFYILTPLIAALGGAKKVYALARDSQYGKAQNIKNLTMKLGNKWGVGERISVLLSRDDERIAHADIVTNLGFVRPLDAFFLKKLKSTVVIPLMWETWEFRPEDLDLTECRRLAIPVLGTNEHHPDLEIFRYVGHLAIKLLFELNIEVFRSKIVLIGSGEFGKFTLHSLQSTGASVIHIRVTKGETLQSTAARQALSECDAIVVAENLARETLIGQNGQITAKQLRELNPGVSIAHISGGVSHKEISAAGIPCRPDHFALPSYMSLATDYLGPKPLIDLHTAGLRVGEQLAIAKKKGLSGFEAELKVLKETPLAQGFSGYHNI